MNRRLALSASSARRWWPRQINRWFSKEWSPALIASASSQSSRSLSGSRDSALAAETPNKPVSASRSSMFSTSDSMSRAHSCFDPCRNTGWDRSTKTPPPGPRRIGDQAVVHQQLECLVDRRTGDAELSLQRGLEPEAMTRLQLHVGDPGLERAPDHLGYRVEHLLLRAGHVAPPRLPNSASVSVMRPSARDPVDSLRRIAEYTRLVPALRELRRSPRCMSACPGKRR